MSAPIHVQGRVPGALGNSVPLDVSDIDYDPKSRVLRFRLDRLDVPEFWMTLQIDLASIQDSHNKQ